MNFNHRWFLRVQGVTASVFAATTQSYHSGRSTKGWVSDLLQDGNSITYPCLVDLQRRGLRNGSWRHLDTADRALFRCAFWVAKVRGKISNTKLMVQVLRVALKIVQTVSRIGRAGRTRATMMVQEYAKPGGVFSWAPRVRGWLHDPRYQTYLGLSEVNR
jgi:hypothetical protein